MNFRDASMPEDLLGFGDNASTELNNMLRLHKVVLQHAHAVNTEFLNSKDPCAAEFLENEAQLLETMTRRSVQYPDPEDLRKEEELLGKRKLLVDDYRLADRLREAGQCFEDFQKVQASITTGRRRILGLHYLYEEIRKTGKWWRIVRAGIRRNIDYRHRRLEDLLVKMKEILAYDYGPYPDPPIA